MKQPIPAKHKTFLNHVLKIFKKDKRCVGIGIQGSYLTGEMDEFSDLDLIVLVEEEFYEEILKERKKIALQLGDLVNAFTGEHVGVPELLICLYRDENLHVDLKFCTSDMMKAERFENPEILWQRDEIFSRSLVGEPQGYKQPNMQWIEDRYWTWVHYIAMKLARGELFAVMSMMDYLRRVVIFPLSRKLRNSVQRGERRLEMDLPNDIELLKLTCCDCYDVKQLSEALKRMTDIYLDLRNKLINDSITINFEAEEFSKRCLDQVLINKS